MFPEEFSSERLKFKQLSGDVIEADSDVSYEELFDLFNGEEGEAFIVQTPYEEQNTIGDTRDFVDQAEEHWDNQDIAHYLLKETDSGRFLGIALVFCDWERDFANPGVLLTKDAHHMGLGTEAGLRLFGLVFRTLRFDTIVEWVVEEAPQYQVKIGDKLFEQLDGEIQRNERIAMESAGEPVEVQRKYTLTKDAFEENHEEAKASLVND